MENKYPTSFQTVDIVILDDYRKKILLGRKKNQLGFRFVGGFVDPKDNSLEQAANRERIEETGINLECSQPEYKFSQRIDDPRYRDSEDKILSAIFVSKYIFGYPIASDDIFEVQWFDIEDFKKNYKDLTILEHHVIVERLIKENII